MSCAWPCRGSRVLFAFLLVVPFQQAFGQLSEIGRYVYFAGLRSSACAIAFLITPATYHRLNLRRGVEEKEQMLMTASRLIVIGTGFLAIGIACSMFLIADFMFGLEMAILVVLATLFVIISLWFALPITRRVSSSD